MTKDRLRQIESLVCELEEERERFAREARHHKRIEETYGVGCLFGRDALDAARDRLQAIEAECQDERDTVRQWIDSVSDSMTRRALRLRYLDGKSWSECARRMGYADESGPRKLVERYLRCKNRACLNVQERENGGNVKIESVLRYIYKCKGKSRM